MCQRKPHLTMYKKPNCVQCDASIRALGDTAYDVVDLTQDEGAMAAVKELGYKQAPVVVARYPDGHEEHWAGFRHDKITDYKNAAKRWGSNE